MQVENIPSIMVVFIKALIINGDNIIIYEIIFYFIKKWANKDII